MRLTMKNLAKGLAAAAFCTLMAGMPEPAFAILEGSNRAVGVAVLEEHQASFIVERGGVGEGCEPSFIRLGFARSILRHRAGAAEEEIGLLEVGILIDRSIQGLHGSLEIALSREVLGARVFSLSGRASRGPHPAWAFQCWPRVLGRVRAARTLAAGGGGRCTSGDRSRHR